MIDNLRIAAMGDIMLDRDVGKHFFDSPEDFDFKEIGNILSEYDLVIANLENPVGLRGAPHPKQDPHVAFRCHPDTLQVLKNLHVDLACIANNHLLDYGSETLTDTLMHLDNAGIARVGAGNNYEEANQPATFTIKGHKIAVLATVMIYSASTERAKKDRPGVADYSIRPMLKQIRELKQQGYIVLVTVHWGIEYGFYPIPYQREQGQMMMDAGASLILGHGPHFPQGIEKYGNGEIVHSMGNFIFDEPYPYSKRSFIYGAEISKNGELIENEVIPVTLINHIPVIDEPRKVNKVLAITEGLGKAYKRKSKDFWKNVNSRWFQDIVWRVSDMGSAKFIFLPPVKFYFSLGVKRFLKKLSFNNLAWAIKLSFKKLIKAS